MNEFIIKEDGTIVKRQWTDTPVNILPGIEKAFQSNIAVRVQNVVDFSDMGEPYFGKCSLAIQTADLTKIWASTRIKMLNLHTTYKLDGGKTLFPSFDSDGKFIEIPWAPPADMRLVLGMTINANNEMTAFKLEKHYLVAYDAKGVTWRMPLTNLYDHLELCHGQTHVIHPTLLGTVYIGLKQFRSSKWNADLRGDWHQEMAPKMFSFTPNKEGFDQRPINDKWTKLCTKASSEIVNQRIQIVEL